MRVAVLSDIHGNLPALEAVLRDVEDSAPDVIVLNGDILEGPLPVETFDRLDQLGDRAIWIKGNGDRWLVEAFDGVYTPQGTPADPTIIWSATQIEQRHRGRLANLPHSVTLDVTGLGPVAFCHATARDDNETVLVDSPIELYREAYADFSAQTVVVGHTHMPFDRLADRRRIVNPGSVGMPYGHTGAAWALLGPDIVLRRTHYDLDAAASALSVSGMPGIEEFLAHNVCTTHSDAEALKVFRPLTRAPSSLEQE